MGRFEKFKIKKDETWCPVSVTPKGRISFSRDLLSTGPLKNSKWVALYYSKRHPNVVLMDFSTKKIPSAYKLQKVHKNYHFIPAQHFFEHVGIDPQQYHG